jgi:hypothetical protein
MIPTKQENVPLAVLAPDMSFEKHPAIECTFPAGSGRA